MANSPEHTNPIAETIVPGTPPTLETLIGPLPGDDPDGEQDSSKTRDITAADLIV